MAEYWWLNIQIFLGFGDFQYKSIPFDIHFLQYRHLLYSSILQFSPLDLDLLRQLSMNLGKILWKQDGIFSRIETQKSAVVDVVQPVPFIYILLSGPFSPFHDRYILSDAPCFITFECISSFGYCLPRKSFLFLCQVLKKTKFLKIHIATSYLLYMPAREPQYLL